MEKMDVDDLKDTIHSLLSGNIPILPVLAENEKRFIWAKQSAPQPKPTYAVMNIISGFTKLSSDTMEYSISDDDFKLCGAREFTLSLQIRGAGALQLLSDFQTKLEDPSLIEQFNDVGLSIHNLTRIVDLAGFLETTWEDVRQMDLMMYVSNDFGDADTTTLGIYPIEKVEGEYNISGRTGTYDVDSTQ